MPGVPYIFGNATTSIPLTNLDANFNTGLTIGNTTVGLGNTVTTLGNVTLTNATITPNTSSIAANAVVYSNTSGNLTGNASVFTVSGTNVGIGTTSPNYQLHVAGNTVGLGKFERTGTTTGSTQVSFVNGGNTGYIGVDNSAGNDILGVGGAAYGFTLSSSGAYPIVMGTNGTERMRITSGGYVGIGTTSPSSYSTLAVNGSISTISNNSLGVYNSDNTNFFYLNNAGSSGANNAVLTFSCTNKGELMRLNSSGTLFVGSTTDSPGSSSVVTNGPLTVAYPGTPSSYRQLYFSSNNNFYFSNGSNQGYLSSAGAWTNASDARLKEQITDIKYGIDDVMKMQPRNYQMISDKTKCVGFIAQELQTVIPECVSGDDEHFYGVDYGTLTAVLTKAIQEQQAIIEQLKAKVGL
jgi:Chaperone of endosialidase